MIKNSHHTGATEFKFSILCNSAPSWCSFSVYTKGTVLFVYLFFFEKLKKVCLYRKKRSQICGYRLLLLSLPHYGTRRGKRRQNGCKQPGTALLDPSGRGDKRRTGVSWHQPATLGCRDWRARQSAERGSECQATSECRDGVAYRTGAGLRCGTIAWATNEVQFAVG